MGCVIFWRITAEINDVKLKCLSAQHCTGTGTDLRGFRGTMETPGRTRGTGEPPWI